MIVYEILCGEKVFQLSVDLDSSVEFYQQFDGRELASSWSHISVSIADEPSFQGVLGDFTLLGTVPVMSARAVAALSDVIGSRTEMLPLQFEAQNYFAINVTRMVDALDDERTVANRFQNSRRMFLVQKYEFFHDRVAEEWLFKVPQLALAHVFATEQFVSLGARAGLTGFKFRERWRSQE
jgi:hypothetical protein